ncbi:MAG: response regulator transcription factor [Flavobacteriales bacterium]|nr:response regulator transcription factor [Flavobacteriales bacterium]MBL4734550.1 response regulator transcription factor [Flavobacteriales bacterium]
MVKTKSKIKILIAEDDPNLGYVVKDSLETEGYAVTLCTDGINGIQQFQKAEYDICILDIMMPRKDGFSLAKDIRNLNEEMPIIFLTAKSLKEDVIKGFTHGADDYVIKPFSIEELSMRIKAILKRTKSEPNGESNRNNFKIGLYQLDYRDLKLQGPGEERKLTRKEADVLKMLSMNQNKLLTREILLNVVWGNDDYFSGRSMDVFISRLRKYLSEDENVKINNIHGEGFRLEVR